jgi:rod shape-determining protein MreD
MRIFLFGFLTFLIGLYLQLFALKMAGPVGSSPHFLLILTMAAGLFHGPVLAQTLGFFWGLSSDTLSVMPFGIQVILLSVTGFASGYMSRYIKRDHVISQMVLILATSIFYILGIYLLTRIFSSTRTLQWSPLWLSTFWNVILTPVVMWGFVYWSRLWSR